jgi:hypothetical protein
MDEQQTILEMRSNTEWWYNTPSLALDQGYYNTQNEFTLTGLPDDGLLQVYIFAHYPSKPSLFMPMCFNINLYHKYNAGTDMVDSPQCLTMCDF